MFNQNSHTAIHGTAVSLYALLCIIRDLLYIISIISAFRLPAYCSIHTFRHIPYFLRLPQQQSPTIVRDTEQVFSWMDG